MTMMDSDVPELDGADQARPAARTKRSAFAIWLLCLALGIGVIALSLAPLARW